MPYVSRSLVIVAALHAIVGQQPASRTFTTVIHLEATSEDSAAPFWRRQARRWPSRYNRVSAPVAQLDRAPAF